MQTQNKDDGLVTVTGIRLPMGDVARLMLQALAVAAVLAAIGALAWTLWQRLG